MGAVIKTVNLTKNFGNLCAVDNLNLVVNQGEILGFLGLNGAGKTTTMRMLLGMIRPSSGESYLQGQQIRAGLTEIWNDVGYLVETANSYPDLTVRENLELVCRLRDIEAVNSVNWIMEKLQLTKYANVKTKNLSLGNGQRLGIAKAIIHKPKVLLLDEPTNGLDPAGIIEIRSLLLDLAENQGVTMIISSHKLAEISRLATNIAIIHEGKLIKNISSPKLAQDLQKTLLVDGKDQRAIGKILLRAGFTLKRCQEVANKVSLPLEILSEDAVNYPEKVATLLVNEGQPPSLLKQKTEDLEAYFMRTIQETGGDKDE